ncbi:MAG: PBP1A family penicillin-binding protein [Rhodospirillaceae bacterium]|nr:PBP1A family penicillin-binding protein [Rhodospirillaceae bacterium]
MADEKQSDDAPDKAARKPKRGKAPAKGPTRAGAWRWVANILAVGVWAFTASLLILGWLSLDLPAIDEAALTRKPNIVLLDSSGQEFASFGDIYGPSVAVRDLPKHLPAAVVAVEDRRFYEHPGIDLRGLARAMVENLKAARVVQGGSTITQQVAKNLFLSPERTIGRKLREMLLAWRLEQAFTKDQILAIYLNRVYLGAGTYGVEAAAQRYFGRSAREVSVYQAAVLAGLLKAPSRYNPINDAELAAARADIVLGTMVDTGALTPAQAAAAKKNASRILKTAAANKPSQRARYFADWILPQVESFLGAVDRDLIVRTTLNSALQTAAETALTRALAGSGEALRIEQGAVLVLSPDGAVRAMVGGRDYDDSQFNRVTQALRQPGSAFKPFVYLAGLEAGYDIDDMVTDAPINISGWKPQNFSGDYKGPVTIETAVAQSINTIAVRVAQQVGPTALVNVAKRLGITAPMKPELSLALGSAEVTLLELTSAYAPFANGGAAVLPYAIVEIAEHGGQPLYRRQGTGLGQVMSEENLVRMNHLLRGVIETGTGVAAAFGYPAAGKTGTSSDFRDAWFVGYSADYVAGVWVGNDSGAFMKNVTGGGVPARIWRDVMSAAHSGTPRKDLPGLEKDDNPFVQLWRSIIGD